MLNIYTSYKCKRCKKEMILITEEVETTQREGKYLSCSHCGSKHIVKEKATNDLREVMQEHSYKKEHGVIKQMR